MPVDRSAMVERLDEIVAQADSWLLEHVDSFDPFAGSSRAEIHARRKALSELSIYLHVARSTGPPAPEACHRSILSWVADDDFPRAFRRRPREIAKYGYPAAYAANHGDEPVQVVDAARSILRNGRWTGGRSPYRRLEAFHVGWLLGYTGFEFELSTTLRRSYLGHPPDPIRATVADGYALTHSAFAASDYGTDPTVVADDLTDRELAELPGLLVRFLSEGNHDLALELLLTGVICETVSLRTVAPVVEWAHGAIHGEGLDAEPVEMGGPGERPAVEGDSGWVEQYHPRIVAGTTARVLRSSLDGARDSDVEPARLPELERLGDVVSDLASYDLRSGAEALLDVCETRLVDDYPATVRMAVEFLRRQRDGDRFGYWVDERRLFEARGNDPALFRERHVEPTTRICEEAIARADDALG